MRPIDEVLRDKIAQFNILCGAEKLYKKVLEKLELVGNMEGQNILVDSMISLMREINHRQMQLNDEIQYEEKPAEVPSCVLSGK